LTGRNVYPKAYKDETNSHY